MSLMRFDGSLSDFYRSSSRAVESFDGARHLDTARSLIEAVRIDGVVAMHVAVVDDFRSAAWHRSWMMQLQSKQSSWSGACEVKSKNRSSVCLCQ